MLVRHTMSRCEDVGQGEAISTAAEEESAAEALAAFAPWLRRWRLEPDGAPFATPASRLLPVRCYDAPAMLKLSFEEEERHGGVLMEWWDGEGAARVLAFEPGALLLERATGGRSLKAMAVGGDDAGATRILCDALARLHAPRDRPLPELVPLDRWFEALWPAARSHGGILRRSAAVAAELLAAQAEQRPLHGDIHHDNVLDFGARGWLAIDPKRLFGDRAFDFANIFCNPDVGGEGIVLATRPDIFRRRLDIVTEAAGLDRQRLLRWILAWAGLSAAWFLGDGTDPAVDFRIAELAAEALGG